MQKITASIETRILASLLFILPLITGCEDSGTGWDFGDNNPNLVACIGDSITHGYNSEGAPYPSRLAAFSGKEVLNFGSPGATSSHGPSIIGSAIGRKPGYVCILYGANDAIRGRSVDEVKGNLHYVISVCKANNCKPIIATPPKMIGPHSVFDPASKQMADAIRQLAKEEGVALVNLYKAVGNGESYLVSDGLHLNDAGNNLVAKQFNRRL